MRKLAGYFLSILTMLSILNFSIITAHAAGENQFIIKAYNCYEVEFDEDEEVNVCKGPEGDYPDELPQFASNADVEAGQIIKVDVYYIPGNVTDISMQIGVKYDKTLVEPIYNGSDIAYNVDMTNSNKGGIWPPRGGSSTSKYTDWSVDVNDVPDSNMVKAIVGESKQLYELVESGVLYSLFFKVKEDASAGSVISFAFDNEFTKLAKKPPIITSGINLNVSGDAANSAALDTLTVKNGATSYTLSPTFEAGSTTTKEYTVVVPNQVTSVDIAATPSDSTSALSGTGNGKSVNVGNNSFDIIVTTQDSQIETYQVKVYRLSNDATLSALSLSNGVDIGTFSSSTTNYSAVVPYSTSSTKISATKNHQFAEIKTDLSGTWSLTNTGATKNTKEIDVEAENCLAKYSSVPGNTCTTNKYKIEVSRTAPSTNADLATLTIDGTSVPSFSAGTTTYTLPDVTISTESVNVQATVAEPGKATITSELGTKTLSVGDNAITVTVQAEDGTTTKTYTVNIKQLSNDSKLKTLTVTSPEGGTFSPTFSSTTYDYYTFTAPSTSTTATISATVNDTGKASIVSGIGTFNIAENPSVDVIVQAEDGTQSIYVVKLTREKSTNAYLKSLSIDGYTINETFNKETTSYTASVASNVDTVTINAEVEDTGKATIKSGTGSKTLVTGPNEIKVIVKAESGAEKEYTLTITKAPKSISALTDLTVDGTTVTGFAEDTLEYTLSNVSNSTTSITIGATKKDPDSTVTGIGTINLSTGDNKLYVTVTAEDGTSQTSYIINVYREKDANAYLEYIKINSTLIDGFEKTTKTYSITVPNSTTSLDLSAKAESDSATVVPAGNSNFSTTQVNPVTITVTAEAGNIEVYTINVTREKSDNNYLSGITLSSGSLDPTFVKTVDSYTVDVDRNVTSITITPTTEDSTATAVVSGPTSLVIGENTFTITVTSEKGTDKTYTVIVNRNKSNNNYLSDLTVDSVTITGFAKTTESYSITVPATTESITIGASVEDILSSTIIRKQGDTTTTSSTSNTFNLVTGLNTFEVLVTAEDDTQKTYTVEVTKEKSDDDSLSALSITQASISPTFSSSVTSYTATVGYEVTSIDISATATHPQATVTGTGNKTLSTGDNTFDIVVTSEDETTTKTYTIVVTRAKNDNAHLSNLTVSSGTLDPEFDRETTSYTVSVANNVSSITLTGYKEDPNAVSVVGDGTIALNTGDNTINIVVTAEDATTTKTYTVVVTRALSSDVTLKALTVSSGTLSPAFDPDDNKSSYEVTVPNEIEDLTINATPTSNVATVSVTGNTNLAVGENTATITVTAEDGSIGTYDINITRQPSSNNFLTALSVKDSNDTEYITSFGKTTLTYNITVSNEVSSVTISATLEDATSTVTGAGVKNLEIGDNSFSVEVTSEANITRTYVINITREANSNNFLSSLEVVDQTLSPAFDKDTTNYTVDVPSNVNTITINAAAEVATSTITGTGEHTITTGANTINIDVTSEDSSVKTYVIVVNKAASNNKYLSNLTVSPGTLDPAFNKDTNSYTVNVDNTTTTLTITASSEDPNATITGDGIKALSVGTQRFDVVVTAEDGIATNTYSIVVTREASSVKDLSDLTVDGTTITGFNKDVTEYSLSVDNDVTSITIGATLVDETSTIAGLGQVNLNTGSNEVNVTVTAEDGTFKVYTINVTRAKSSNNYLNSLSVAEGEINPEFNKEVSSYTLSVPYENTSVTISALTEDPTATIEITNDNNLSVGTNNVQIKVKAEDETERTYSIIVTRQEFVDNFLDDITIVGNDGENYVLDPAFSKDTGVYDVEISPSLTSVNINATLSDSNATVEGIGDIAITSLPQEHSIVVRAVTGQERTYKLTFKQGLSSNNKLLNITVAPGSLSQAFDPDVLNYVAKVPEGTSQVTITAVKSDEKQVVVGDGEISFNDEDKDVNISVTAENGSVRVYTVTLKSTTDSDDNKIKSDIHIVGDVYIETIKELTSAETIKNEMLNPNEFLKIYNLNGDEISDTDNVGTGYVIKLIKDDEELDSKTLIIKGDINSNGEIEVGDILLLKRHVLETIELKNYQIIAGDVNNDDDSGVADILMMKRHILGTYTIGN